MKEYTICEECGSDMTTSIEDYHYTQCGLDNVMLRDVEISRCPECGSTSVNVGDLQKVHGDIAKSLIDKEGDLSYEETRFLCNYAVARLEGWPYINIIGEA